MVTHWTKDKQQFISWLHNKEQLESTLPASLQRDPRWNKTLAIINRVHMEPQRFGVGKQRAHALRVANIYWEELGGREADYVYVALLHDILRHEEYNFDWLANEYGLRVARSVRGLTQLEEQPHVDYLKQLFNSQDDDMILVKVADRLDTSRSQWHLLQEKPAEAATAQAPLKNFMEILSKSHPVLVPKFEETLV